MSEEPYQSLYRRFRPQRFAEVRGQDHVTTALRNAVRNDRVAHAYLFSGPRGTGKTSTARILAKALNCTNLVDGEPDCICDSCLAVQAGTSFDVVELDAASNNGVDAMRELVSRAALGSPGRRKVYIVDEVHMLSAAASNALLKTLEEPPAHVVFVLATTDPQKVLPTIRSRTQSFEFRLLAPELLSSLVADLNEQADLGLAPTDLDRVVRRGNGSARDTLSALDQAAALGAAEDSTDTLPKLVEALIAHDVGAALVAVAEAAQRGRDPQRLTEEIIAYLRSAFLVVMAPAVSGVLDHERPALDDQARRLGNAATVRAMEVLGETLIEMKEALDARITLEMALVRLCVPAADTSAAALLERIENLERRMGNVAQAAPGPAPGPSAAGRLTGAPPAPGADASAAGRLTGAPPTGGPPPAVPAGPPPSAPPAPSAPRAAAAGGAGNPFPGSGGPSPSDQSAAGRLTGDGQAGSAPPAHAPSPPPPGPPSGSPGPAGMAGSAPLRPTADAPGPPPSGPPSGSPGPAGMAGSAPLRPTADAPGPPPSGPPSGGPGPAATAGPSGAGPVVAATGPGPSASTPATGPPPPSAPPGGPGPTAGRPTIGALRQRSPQAAPPSAPPAAPTVAAAVAIGSAPVQIDRDELTRVWGDRIFPSLAPGPKSIYRNGRWLSVDGGVATFAIPAQYSQKAEEKRVEVEQALASHLGGRLAVRLELDQGGPPPAAVVAAPPPVEDILDDEPSPDEFATMEVAPDAPASTEARLLQAFPGTEEVTT